MKSPGPLILVVDDEPAMRRLLRHTLEADGYAVTEAETGRLGLAQAATRPPELVVLDLGLPDLGGLEMLRQLREWSDVPVLVLTVLTGEGDKVAALDAGADDYVTKPFGAAELTARLRALRRRVRAEDESVRLTIGAMEIDFAMRQVWRGGVLVKLTALEYDIFRMLVMNRGKVVTHRQLLRELWGPAETAHTHYLRLHMTHLRQKLEDDPAHPRHLKTEWGVGFRFVE